jgi:molecular chaperone GrpE (heat shock protein)
MNAVDVEETVDVPDGIVLEVYRTGYMIDTNVLQPAQVKVARGPEKDIKLGGKQ